MRRVRGDARRPKLPKGIVQLGKKTKDGTVRRASASRSDAQRRRADRNACNDGDDHETTMHDEQRQRRSFRSPKQQASTTRHRRRARRSSKPKSARASASTEQDEQWVETWPTRTFTASRARARSRCSSAASPMAHDFLVEGALQRPRLQRADARRARQRRRSSVGKEFGNRGQCNPTYFTVGNLVKYLIYAARQAGHDRRGDRRATTCSSPRARAARAASACTSPSTARRCATPASTASASCFPADRAASSRRPATTPGLELNPTFFIGARSRRSSPAT